MDCEEIKNIFENELLKREVFSNFHGITQENVHSFAVEPYSALVEPDDCKNPPRDMWIVMQENKNNIIGYLIAYDHSFNQWGVVEHLKDNSFILVCCGDSLSEVLSGM